MSHEILDQLEGKIRQAVETIQYLQLEVEELKEKNNQTKQENDALRSENDHLKAEQSNWQDRLRSLLGQIDNI